MNNFIEYHDEKTPIINGVLDLSWKKIKDFSNIKGLDRTTSLKELTVLSKGFGAVFVELCQTLCSRKKERIPYNHYKTFGSS